MKVAFILQEDKLPVPDTMGGAVEALAAILLEQNEKAQTEHEFYFIQSKIKETKYQPNIEYKHNKVVLVKHNRFFSHLVTFINKALKKLKFKSKLKTFFPNCYQNKVLKEVIKINPDLIVFIDNIDANLPKYTKIFGKEKLYLHAHTDFDWQPNVYGYVAGLICVSDYIKRVNEQRCNYYEGNDYVLTNCVRENLYEKKLAEDERTALRKQLGFDESDFVVVYCGRLRKHKGVDKLVSAVLQSNKNIKLLIIGSNKSIKKEKTPYIKYLESLISKDPGRVVFTGFVEKQNLYKYYQCADLQVLPSICEEAAPLVLIEGQLCGLPQIVTRAGGIPEYAASSTIILEKDEELVDNLSKSITKLSNDKDTLRKMSEDSLNNSKKFRQEDYYKRFVDFIERAYNANKTKIK